MKLNKVMALALSGLMAVSMLAGCSNGTPNGEENNEGQNTTTDVVSVMNDAQSFVEFKVDPSMDSALAAAVQKAGFGQVENASSDYNVKYSDVLTSTDKVWAELNKKIDMHGVALDFSTITVAAGGEYTYNVLYTVACNGLSEEAAVKQIADGFAATMYPEVVSVSTDHYNATYTGSVSVDTATVTNQGKTVSAYYILMSITETVGRDKVQVN